MHHVFQLHNATIMIAFDHHKQGTLQSPLNLQLDLSHTL